jgi:ABC-type multidrug transport system permease subunit
MITMAVKSWLAILAIVRKDIGVWLRQPTAITATILPAIAFMIILYFGAQAVGRNPVAIVVQDNGPRAQELVSILNSSDAFKVSLLTAKQDEAEQALKHIQVAAVITIPSNFDIAFNAHKSNPVTIHINNLNLDFTNDLRRSLPAAISEFYSATQGNNNIIINNNNNTNINNPIKIHVKETDLRKQDIDLLRFEIVPNVVLLLTTAGIVNAGLATAREWEDSTIKELLLSPISRSSLIAGKLMAGWLTTLLVAAVVLVLGALTGYLRPEGLFYWLTTIAIIMLIALTSVGIGVAIGSAARRFQRVTAVGIPLSIDLFFLSGGITVAAFLPAWLQTVAHFIPTFYGTHALQTSIFYSSTEDLAQDILVLVGTAFATIALAVFSLRRSTLV